MFEGIATYPAVVFGTAKVLARSRVTQGSAKYGTPMDCATEKRQLLKAVAAVKLRLTKLLRKQQLQGDTAEILEVYILVLSDKACLGKLVDIIYRERCHAAAAVDKYLQQLQKNFTPQKENVLLIAHVFEAVLLALMYPQSGYGVSSVVNRINGSCGAGKHDNSRLIAVADDISVPELLALKQSNYAAAVISGGGKYDHLAIVAQSLQFALLLSVRRAPAVIRDGQALIVDNINGKLIVDPTPSQQQHYRNCGLAANGTVSKPDDFNVARQGKLTSEIKLLLNINFVSEVELIDSLGADGIGLFRSEFLFINSTAAKLLDEEYQYQVYSQLAQRCAALPVTIRALDLAPDKNKVVGGISKMSASALGLHSIRWTLQQKEIFLTQLRAVMRAGADRQINFLIPMLTHQSEIKTILTYLELAQEQLLAKGYRFARPRLGMMVEVPAAALCIQEYLNYFDFVSIGSNDLTQYVLAADRGDSEVAYLYDSLHPAVLTLIKHVIETAARAGKEVTLCGELAGDGVGVEMLMAMGLKNFSLTPNNFLAVKNRLVQVDKVQAQVKLTDLLAGNSLMQE